jgi:hypothetical protein
MLPWRQILTTSFLLTQKYLRIILCFIIRCMMLRIHANHACVLTLTKSQKLHICRSNGRFALRIKLSMRASTNTFSEKKKVLHLRIVHLSSYLHTTNTWGLKPWEMRVYKQKIILVLHFCSLFESASELYRANDRRLSTKLVRLCGLVVRVPGYRSRDPGSILSNTRFSKK